MSKCMNCGHSIVTDAKHCGECGTAVISCSNCSNLLRDGEKYCTQCGVAQASLANQGELTRQQCPKCSESILSTAIVCSHCQFEIGKYKENISSVKITAMVKSNRDHRMFWLRDKYKREPSSHSFMWILYILLGIILCFVPLVGWFLAPAMFFWAFVSLVVALFAPVRGAIMLNYFTDRDTYKADQASAESRSSNTYVEAVCPVCDYSIASIQKKTLYSWQDEKIRNVKCPGCEKISTRIDNVLLWVPYPAIALRGSLKEYLPAEVQVQAVDLSSVIRKDIESPKRTLTRKVLIVAGVVLAVVGIVYWVSVI